MAKAFGVGESQTGNVWGLLYGVPSYRQLEYRLSTEGRGGEGRRRIVRNLGRRIGR